VGLYIGTSRGRVHPSVRLRSALKMRGTGGRQEKRGASLEYRAYGSGVEINEPAGLQSVASGAFLGRDRALAEKRLPVFPCLRSYASSARSSCM
jgi:hypothetical protein